MSTSQSIGQGPREHKYSLPTQKTKGKHTPRANPFPKSRPAAPEGISSQNSTITSLEGQEVTFKKEVIDKLENNPPSSAKTNQVVKTPTKYTKAQIEEIIRAGEVDINGRTLINIRDEEREKLAKYATCFSTYSFLFNSLGMGDYQEEGAAFKIRVTSTEIFTLIQQKPPDGIPLDKNFEATVIRSKFINFTKEKIEKEYSDYYKVKDINSFSFTQSIAFNYAVAKAKVWAHIVCFLFLPGIDKLVHDFSKNITEDLTVNLKNNYEHYIKGLVGEVENLTTTYLKLSNEFSSSASNTGAINGNRSDYITSKFLEFLQKKKVVQRLSQTLLSRFIPEFCLFTAIRARFDTWRNSSSYVNKFFGFIVRPFEFLILSPIEKLSNTILRFYLRKNLPSWIDSGINETLNSTKQSPYRAFIYETLNDLVKTLKAIDPTSVQPRDLFSKDEEVHDSVKEIANKLIEMIHRAKAGNPHADAIARKKPEDLNHYVVDLIERLSNINSTSSFFSALRDLEKIVENANERKKLTEAIIVYALKEVIPNGLIALANVFQYPEQIAKIENIALKGVNTLFEATYIENCNELARLEGIALDKLKETCKEFTEEVLKDTTHLIIEGQKKSDILKRLEQHLLNTVRSDFLQEEGVLCPYQTFVNSCNQLDQLYEQNTHTIQDRITDITYRNHNQLKDFSIKLYQTIFEKGYLENTYDLHVATEVRKKLQPIFRDLHKIADLTLFRGFYEAQRNKQKTLANSLARLDGMFILGRPLSTADIDRYGIILTEIAKIQTDLQQARLKTFNTPQEIDETAATFMNEMLDQSIPPKTQLEKDVIINQVRSILRQENQHDIMQELNTLLPIGDDSEKIVQLNNRKTAIKQSLTTIIDRERIKSEAYILILRYNLSKTSEQSELIKEKVRRLEHSEYIRKNTLQTAVIRGTILGIPAAAATAAAASHIPSFAASASNAAAFGLNGAGLLGVSGLSLLALVGIGGYRVVTSFTDQEQRIRSGELIDDKEQWQIPSPIRRAASRVSTFASNIPPVRWAQNLSLATAGLVLYPFPVVRNLPAAAPLIAKYVSDEEAGRKKVAEKVLEKLQFTKATEQLQTDITTLAKKKEFIAAIISGALTFLVDKGLSNSSG